MTAREVELARRAAALALRERELEARPRARAGARAGTGTGAGAGAGAGAAGPAAPAAVEADRNGHYNLVTLERPRRARSSEFPDRAEEWTSYLYFLRDYAAPDGSLPDSFDALISDTFSDLL